MSIKERVNYAVRADGYRMVGVKRIGHLGRSQLGTFNRATNEDTERISRRWLCVQWRCLISEEDVMAEVKWERGPRTQPTGDSPTLDSNHPHPETGDALTKQITRNIQR